MIPANKSHIARFKNDDSSFRKYSELPVIAWDDDGHALVVDAERGCLIRANRYKNFHNVEEAEFDVVTAVPGGGWQAVFERPDGTRFADPTIAWKIHTNGYIVGVGQRDRDGTYENQSEFPGFIQYLAPGEEIEGA